MRPPPISLLLSRLRHSIAHLTDSVAATDESPQAAPAFRDPERPLSADRPIGSRAEDLLGRAPLADAIASAFLGWRGGDSLVVALTGPWGSGKSSVKNMALEALRDRPAAERPDILEFTPWQWAGEGELREAFFRELGLALGAGDGGAQSGRLARTWGAYAALLGAGADIARSIRSMMVRVLGVVAASALLLTAVPVHRIRVVLFVVGVVFALLAALLAWAGHLAGMVGRVLTARAQLAQRPVHELREALTALLRDRSRPIIVVIDDIDRLTADEVALVFQLVKVCANFPNVLYFLLFQRDLVERSLEHVAPYAESGKGRAYLEKIVQAAFSLPPVDPPRLERALFTGLDALLIAPGLDRHFDRARWGNLYLGALRPFFRTLRDVHRFLNTLSFHVAIFRGARVLEVNPVDLIGLEVLRTFEPDVYEAIGREKELLTAGAPNTSLYGKDRRQAVGEEIRSLAARASESRRDSVAECIRRLFPRAAWAWTDVTFGSPGNDWARELRVCDLDHFDRYFLLATPEGDLSQQDIEVLLLSTGDRAALRAALSALQTRGLLDTAVERLDPYGDTIPPEHAVALATALYDVGDQLTAEMGGRYLISPAWMAYRLINRVLVRETDVCRRAILLSGAIAATDGVFLPTFHVAGLGEAAEESTARDQDEPLLDASAILELKMKCVVKIRAAADAGMLERLCDVEYLLTKWRDWGEPGAARAYASGMVRRPDGALRLIKAFARKAHSTTLGDYVSKVTFTVRLQEVEAVVSVVELEAQLRQLNAATLDADDRKILDAFFVAINRQRRSTADEVGEEVPPPDDAIGDREATGRILGST